MANQNLKTRRQEEAFKFPRKCLTVLNSTSIYNYSKEVALKINNYGWKYGRNGWTTPALNLR